MDSRPDDLPLSTTSLAPTPSPAPTTSSAPMMLYVCTTCRDAVPPPDPQTPCAGARLFAALQAVASDPAVRLVPVECLSVCKRVCSVSFAAPGKWTYVYGDLPPDSSVATILAGARLYADAPDGIIPWKQRPDALKKGVVARIPPLTPPS